MNNIWLIRQVSYKELFVFFPKRHFFTNKKNAEIVDIITIYTKISPL